MDTEKQMTVVKQIATLINRLCDDMEIPKEDQAIRHVVIRNALKKECIRKNLDVCLEN